MRSRKKWSTEKSLRCLSPIQCKHYSGLQIFLSSEPFFLLAFLLDAYAEITEGPVVHVNPNSDVRLHCIFHQHSEVPAFVFWYFDDRMINFDDAKGRRIRTDTKSSFLHISKVSSEDEGNYTCSPSNIISASVAVNIVKGECSAP